MSFSELGLDPLILKSVTEAGYETASPVQVQAIPAALTGRDLLVSSHTGSGKTAAFLLPSIQRLLAEPAVKSIGPRVLVLAPTRELALQVEKSAMKYGKALRRFRTACLVGGAPYGLQLKRISQPVDVVVATPGRLIDHLERGKIDFSRLEVLVLDEADRMLDMGFVDDIRAIAARCPASRQTLLFSATLEGVVGSLAAELTRDAQRIEVEAAPKQEAQIEERLLYADNLDHKQRLLDALLRDVDLTQAIVFAATKRSAEELSDMLADSGFASDSLHGDMQQGQRNRALQRLRDGRTRVLVATDVAARGIDVAGISHVINFDLPRQAEDYVHRIGRTGRAGRTGIAWSLAGMREGGLVRAIERYTGRRIDIHTLPGLEPTQKPASGRPAGKPVRGKPQGARGFGDKRSWNGEARSYGAPRPARGEGRDNRDRGYRLDAPRGSRFEETARADHAQRTWGNRMPREEETSKPDVDGNSVAYWEKREREARAQAKAKPAGRSYGDRAAPRGARGPGQDKRGSGARPGVRGRFKD
ncbi:DEAD/DEAH box helicase [Betaproteobacteria bacterium SCN1]|jgi:superfamily II DNA/RNA helicase|nr:DEAD/DEAH box helicase [Betaproteobacteria bacterium SCN1]MBN8760030.1 DEAD/DEAH box helicase [Thiobacillus sp.]ODU90842.1 MAG: RNA helicase [Thiobacillus sp. SCN 65-179]OJW35734.1 MAG: RNA helicase [Thiobacillus sp. 65-69]